MYGRNQTQYCKAIVPLIKNKQIKEKTEAATGMQDHFDLHKANFTGFWERVWLFKGNKIGGLKQYQTGT